MSTTSSIFGSDSLLSQTFAAIACATFSPSSLYSQQNELFSFVTSRSVRLADCRVPLHSLNAPSPLTPQVLLARCSLCSILCRNGGGWIDQISIRGDGLGWRLHRDLRRWVGRRPQRRCGGYRPRLIQWRRLRCEVHSSRRHQNNLDQTCRCHVGSRSCRWSRR